MSEGWVTVMWIAGFWVGIGLIGYTVGRVSAVQKRGKPKPKFRYELSEKCPECGEWLFGTPLTEEDIKKRQPSRAWRVCFACGFEQQVGVQEPWTKSQWLEMEAALKENDERNMIVQYEHEIAVLTEKKRRRAISHLAGLLNQSPGEFEIAVGEILKANGYTEVVVRGGAGDLAVDIECLSPAGKRIAVQCKRYGDKPVGSKEMQTFIGMLHAHHKIKSGIYVTTSRFTQPAQDLAKKHKIDLVDGEELVRRAAVLSPEGEGDEDERIQELIAAKHSTPAWEIVMAERQKKLQRQAHEQRRERIQRARRYGSRRY